MSLFLTSNGNEAACRSEQSPQVNLYKLLFFITQFYEKDEADEETPTKKKENTLTESCIVIMHMRSP